MLIVECFRKHCSIAVTAAAKVLFFVKYCEFKIRCSGLQQSGWILTKIRNITQALSWYRVNGSITTIYCSETLIILIKYFQTWTYFHETATPTPTQTFLFYSNYYEMWANWQKARIDHPTSYMLLRSYKVELGGTSL